MKAKKHSTKHVRPMRVFVGHGSKAEKGFRARARLLMPEPTALAPGLPSTPDHDLVFHGANTIADLVFTNFYIGGANAWRNSDIESIDGALSAAMSDQDLNNVISQYYQSGNITSTFRGSQILSGPSPQIVSQGDVEALVRTLLQAGTLNSFDLAATVFNFMLPSGTVLNTDPAPTSGTIVAPVESSRQAGETRSANTAVPIEEEEDSTQGLGGYHGSVHIGTEPDEQTIYYAVRVFSEIRADGTANGIPVFDQSWKNVVATFYHELNEARTDPDVEDAIRAGDDPNAVNFLGWTSSQGEECGDFPVFEANPISQVFQEVALTDGW